MRTWILRHSGFWAVISGAVLMAGAALTFVTLMSVNPSQDIARVADSPNRPSRIMDRNGMPLTVSFEHQLNDYDTVSLHEIPGFLQQAFVLSEDKRFFDHHGVDWPARLHALWQNVKAMKAVRGASTLTEQVVRIRQPRPRTLWSRWLEGWEAQALERHTGKADILEFYLNQVPYASNRRGLLQAARYYFNRDLDTLTQKEMLALVVLVRAPSRLDLYRDRHRVEASIHRLAQTLQEKGILSTEQVRRIHATPLQLEKPHRPPPAAHFAQYALRRMGKDVSASRRFTTLDGGLQSAVQALLDRRIADLKDRRVRNGAVLVTDHSTNEVLAWAVSGRMNEEVPGSFIDAVTSPRQPGSSMKPLVYALALEMGWTAATVIDDSPLAESVGTGLHSYRNYSRTFYGPVTLRQALGNSLNIPAVKAAKFVGTDRYLDFLRTLGFTTLTQHPDFYGDGLALGNGEVTLFELVQAYTALANRGVYRPLKIFLAEEGEARRVMSPEATSLIASILSDPEARRLEFGTGSVLNLPVQTAVKTGTSTGYRDAWAVGFNHRYAVGVWMGNLDGQAMDQVTGSTGPGLLLRGVFAELNRHRETRPLYLSPRLVKASVCLPAGESQPCKPSQDWFIPGTAPKPAQPQDLISAPASPDLRWVQPTPGLQLAMDPRIPDELEAFEFVIEGVQDSDTVEWILDGDTIARTHGGRTLWPVARGTHQLTAAVTRDGQSLPLSRVGFIVK